MLEATANLYDQLMDHICDLYCNDTCIHSDDLFKKSCEILKINVNFFLKEDIIHLGLYACQIILNGEFFLKLASGNSKKKAYENAVRKFINLCFDKKGISFKYPEYNPESFYLELKESVDSIDLSNILKKRLKEIFENEIKPGARNIDNYLNAKKLLIKDKMYLVETYRNVNRNSVTCSIIINDVLLLQQGDGKDEKDALEKTVTEFLEAYGVISINNPNGIQITNGNVSVEHMLKQMGNLFREKKSQAKDPVNYWDIIQDCAKCLKYDLNVQSGKVRINSVLIVDSEEKNEYVGNIKAGRELIKKISSVKGKSWTMYTSHSNNVFKPEQENGSMSTISDSHHGNVLKPQHTQIMAFPKTTKIYTELERDAKMKSIAVESQQELQNQPELSWNVVNRHFLTHQCNVELKYVNKERAIECTLVFQGRDIIDAVASNRNAAREAAAKKFIEKYLSTCE